MSMSFFYKTNKSKNPTSKKYHITDPVFIWIYALVFWASCLAFHRIDIKLDQDAQDFITTIGEPQTVTTECIIDNLNAQHALLMDASNRRVLYEKDGYTCAPMASTTKIMTLIIALEYGKMDDLVTVSKYAASMPDVQLGIRAGEQYRLSDLLYSLMLESHNDTAVAIAEHIGGSVDGFAALMNEKARELGANNTHFITPNGLDADGHYTTAYDLALISCYAIENPDFLRIVGTPAYSFHEQTKGRAFTVNNKDRFLTSYEGAIGIKTGFTGSAGYCFVGAVRREDRTLVSVVLACGWPPHKGYKWKDTKKMMDYGIEHYSLKEIVAANTSFQSIPVIDSIENAPITPYVGESVSLLIREGENISYDIKLPRILYAPVKKQETVGELTIKIDGKVYKMLPLYADETRTKITYQYILICVLKRYFGCK